MTTIQPQTKTAQHTEGPWFVHQIPGIEKAGKMYPISAKRDPATAIAYVGAQGEPNLANARLMAAAPTLYAAVKQNVDLFAKTASAAEVMAAHTALIVALAIAEGRA